MPELTITVSDADLAQLDKLGDKLGQTARRFTERLVHRNVNKGSDKPPVSNASRAAERALRQLELTRLMRRRHIATLGQIEKQQLAKRFNVTERTIYRDLEVVAIALNQTGNAPDDTLGEPTDELAETDERVAVAG